MTPVISVEHLSKAYRLGQIGTGTFTYDMKLWWAKVRGKPNPLARIGEVDHGNRDGEDLWALRDISFTVEQGEVLGIIGKNGAGKSTLLKILSRVTAPTLGRIRVKGRVASLLEVGTGFHPELTGRENIYLNGAILGMNRREVDRKFDEIVEFAEIAKFIDTPVKRYSSGMYVRLAFAVAAHLEPEILVVDEVLAVGDAEFQKKCLGKMGNVAREGRTVLFVSHNMAAIKSLCTRAINIYQGMLKDSGNVHEVIDTYLTDGKKPAQYGGFLQDAPRKYSTGQAKFLSVNLYNSLGEETSQLYLGEPFKLTIELDVYNEISQAALEVTITTPDGLEIASVRTLDGDNLPIALQTGRRKITISFDVFLLPRRYSIILIIHKIDGAVIDWIERALDFDVINASRFSTDCYRYWPIMRGYVRAQAKWQFSKGE